MDILNNLYNAKYYNIPNKTKNYSELEKAKVSKIIVDMLSI